MSEISAQKRFEVDTSGEILGPVGHRFRDDEFNEYIVVKADDDNTADIGTKPTYDDSTGEWSGGNAGVVFMYDPETYVARIATAALAVAANRFDPVGVTGVTPDDINNGRPIANIPKGCKFVIQTKGIATISNVGASCAANVPLNIIGTNGGVDDAGTTPVTGIHLNTAQGASAGSNDSVILRDPFIGSYA